MFIDCAHCGYLTHQKHMLASKGHYQLVSSSVHVVCMHCGVQFVNPCIKCYQLLYVFFYQLILP